MKRFKPNLLFVLLLCISCNNKGQSNQPQKDAAAGFTTKTNQIAGNFSNQQTIKFDAVKIPIFFTKYPQLNAVKKELDSFYNHRKYAFAWFDNNGMIEQAGNLFTHITNINNEGVKNKSAYITEFVAMMGDGNADGLNVDTEIMLTAQYFAYAKNVWTGLSEKESKRLNWYLPRKEISYYHLLDSFINGKDVLNSPPVYRQYALLKNQLKKYKNFQKGGGFPFIDTEKKVLKKDDSSSVIVDIKKWLFIMGDLPEDNASTMFDNSLEIAIKKMQQRFGLKVDGIVNQALIKEMNVPLETRLLQIMVNMERSRWVPVTISTDYLVLNIPEFKLHAYEHDSLLWSMDAVVGKPIHKTVIFSGKIQYVVFSPYWNVPTSILRHEILPGLRHNKNYLSRHHMEWNAGNIRQRSGVDNAVGLVKFLFPNEYNIYLHDTPSKSLFGETTRAFSHGCIRLSDAEKLANYLLKNDTAWTAQKINAAMHLGKEEIVIVKKSETVFIVYFTAWVDVKGQLNFRNDLYARDKRLAAMLLKKDNK